MGSHSHKTVASDCQLDSSGFDYSFFKHEGPEAPRAHQRPQGHQFTIHEAWGTCIPS